MELLQGGVSECRNKSLQLMFQLMGGGNKAGSGMDKIRAGWRAQHWRSPRLEESAIQAEVMRIICVLRNSRSFQCQP
jgi:predicted HTH transcriptional regulator